MKSKHRHELRTNELAEWLSNLPQWTKKNLKMIIYISVFVILVVGSYAYHRYQRDVVAVRKQLKLTGLIAQLPRYKAQILQSQARGFDNSYMLIQLADDMEAAARNAKDDQMAALALIKRAEVLRMELHYRLGQVNSRDVEAVISQAKSSYTEAFEKASNNSSLMAMAKFGLGLCEEELGNFAAAARIYRDIATDLFFEGTTALVQAKRRLGTMADYQQEVVFLERPKPTPAESIEPQVESDDPERAQLPSDTSELFDANLSNQ